MKTTILTIVLAFISVTSFTQEIHYQQKMGEILQQYGQCKTIEDFQKVANQFKMMANAEKDEWLPLYYYAHTQIMMSFMTSDGPDQKDALLDEADHSIQKMLVLAPDEVEVLALHAFYYSAKMVIDPINRGPQLGMIFGQTIGKALSIEPNNPRVRYLKLAQDVGSASFFGTDPTDYKDALESLLADWDDYKPKSPLHPNWGKNQVEGLLRKVSK